MSSLRIVVTPRKRAKSRSGNLQAVLASSASLIALTAMLTSMPQSAYAVNECGAPVGGVVTCTGNNYPSPGIRYAVTSSLTLTLDNPALVAVKTTTGQGAVFVGGSSINDIVINALLFQSVQATGILSNGIGAVDSGTAGSAVIRMDTGTVTASGSSTFPGALLASINNSAGTGNALITLNGGQASNTGAGQGVSAQNSGMGNAAVTMTGGSVSSTTGTAMRAIITNATSSGTANVTIGGGTVTTSSGIGVLSQSELGNAGITMTAGTVEVQSGTNPALIAVVNNAAGTGSASITMSGGTVTNSGSGDGLFASNKGTGTYDISVTGGTVTGGSGTGAAIHGDAAAGGTIAIGSGAIVNAGASGIALNQTGGAATVTTAGTLTGNINLSTANNVLDIKGGTIDGNISGGGNSALGFDLGTGNSFTYGAAYTISGMDSVAMNSGLVEIDGSLATNTLAVNGGSLILNSAPTVSGGTTISAGTLQLGNGGTSGSITGDVTNNGTLAFNRSDAYSFAGTISGSGVVSQIGSGTTILTADNSYTGDTTIAGTLQLGNGSTTGSILGDVVNTGTLAFNRSDLYLFDGVISGSGAIRQIGSGLIRLTGDSSGFTGTTSVKAGTLAVNGSLCGDVNVLGGGRLQGIGTVCDTNNAGTVAPGNSIGTLTINGNYIGSGGVLEIETALGGDASPTDRLVVTGDTSGSAGVRVINVGGTGAQTIEGIKIVDVGGASNGAFSLLGDYVINGEQAVVAGAYGYTLHKNGVSTPSDGDWYLRSALTSPAEPGEPENPGEPGVPGNPGGPEGPIYQPGVPIYEAYASGPAKPERCLDPAAARRQSLLGRGRQWCAGARRWPGNGRSRTDPFGRWRYRDRFPWYLGTD